MALEEYNKKRNFKQTEEPQSGKKHPKKGQLIFVVQRHAASRLHYDLRLEMDGVLKSWAVPKGPSLDPADKRLAMMTEDHPYEYHNFEGSIPEGNYGAGEMEVWDSGTYEALQKVEEKEDDLILRHELHKGSIKFVLHGKKLQGEFALVKIKNPKEDNAWLLIKHKDAFAEKNYDAEEHTAPDSKVSALVKSKKSSKTSATAKEVKYFAPPLSGEKKIENYIKPMLAKLTDQAFNSKEWVFEIKWDGYRAIADLRDEDHLLYSRNGLSFKEKFSAVADALKEQPFKMVLDGEIIAHNAEGKPDFQKLQQIGDNPNMALTYQVFDLLWLNGHSTESLTLIERKELLKKALQENDLIKYCDHVPEKGKDFFEKIRDLQLEGMIAKKAASTYIQGGRSEDWLKVKFTQTEDVIICGFTEPKGSRKGFGALILGRMEEGEIIYCGHTGTGFNKETLEQLSETFEPLVTKKSPFEKVPKTNAPATWLKPELVCEIKFSEITKDGIFRHPVYLRLREDKEVNDMKEKTDITDGAKADNADKKEKKAAAPKKAPVKKQKEVENIPLKLTNQDKIYFPESGYTKGDVVNYYQSVADYILPHL